MFRAFVFEDNVYIIRLCHLPTLSETIRLENYKGESFTPPNGNVKEFLRQIITQLDLNISLTKDNGMEKTTNELGKEIISVM